MRITPIRDLVVVLPDAFQETTEGGIVIPDHELYRRDDGETRSYWADRPHTTGTIVAVGRGAPCRKCHAPQRVDPELTVGARVLFASKDYSVVTFAGHSYLLLHEGDLLAIVENHDGRAESHRTA